MRMLSTRTLACCNVLAFRIRKVLDKIGSFATYNQKIVSVISIFVNERVPDDCCQTAFKILVRNCGLNG